MSAFGAKPRVVVAGPSSDLTIPGVMTTEVVGALAPYADVTRVAVNSGKHFDSGLDRAHSLASNRRLAGVVPRVLRTPRMVWQRRQRCDEFFDDGVTLGVALAWPGINCTWIGDFVRAANAAGALSVVLLVSHPTSGQMSTNLARLVSDADLVLVGDVMDATLLSATLGKTRPIIEIHRSLSLTGRATGEEKKTISTFLPKDDEQSLLSVLAAFDAIPTDWVTNYDMRVIMRYSGRAVPDHLNASYHRDHVQLIGEDYSELDLRQIASDSSAISVANPEIESRVFSTAVDEGVATVVLAGDRGSQLGEGYVGGLIADVRRPTSVYVAHDRAVRLSELKFPSPSAWFDLAARLGAMMSDESGGLIRASTL